MSDGTLRPCLCGNIPVIYGNGNSFNFDHIQVMCAFPKGCGRTTDWIKTRDKNEAISIWNRTSDNQGEGK